MVKTAKGSPFKQRLFLLKTWDMHKNRQYLLDGFLYCDNKPERIFFTTHQKFDELNSI